MINIITRTHNRSEMFKVCKESIESQTYKDINWIVGSDVYCPYYSSAIKLDVDVQTPVYIPDNMYFAPWNLYLNELAKYAKEGYVIFLDDDDRFTNEKSLKRIANACEEDTLLVWKVKIWKNFVVPNHSFGKFIQAGDFSGIGMCFHTKHLPVDWGNLSYGDYRVATQLIRKQLKIKWIDMILTETQSGPHNGRI